MALFKDLDSRVCSLVVPSKPAVSTSLIGMLKSSVMPSLRSLVRPGVLSTSAILEPISLLNSVDFPTLGLPMIEIVYISSFRVFMFENCLKGL
jgi:hypothetical protein